MWGDPPPENLTILNFTLQSADGTVAETKAMEVDSEGGALTFEDVPKYTATHFKHDYTVVEEEVPEGYYAVYQRSGSDDSAWKVTNYQGVSTGTCTAGTIWVSANERAIEINADGTRTGKEINLSTSSPTSGAGSDIAITPDAKYLFGVKYYNNRPSTDKPLVIFDVATGAKLKELNLASLGWLGGANYDRVHALHIDGDNIYVKRWKSTEISVYSLQEALAAADGSTLPRKTVISGSKTSAGDIITLDNGDILLSGLTEASVGTGLWIHKKKDDGTYEAAKNVGSVTSVTGYNVNGKIEGLAYYDVTGDGVPEVVITMTSTSGPTSKNSAVAYLTPTPSYNNNSTTQYMPEIFTARDFPYLEGATATRGTGCSATVQIAGSKTWVNDTPENRPTKIRVALYRNDEAAGVKDVGPDENWSWVFRDLPKFDANGVAYRYSTKEVGYFINEDYFEGPPPGYTVTGPPEGSANDFNITNTFASTSLKLTKEWVGNLPENPVPIAFYLERRPAGASGDTPWEKVPNSDIEIFSSDPDQTHTWENLPSGYDYRIVEATELPGYVGSSPVATGDDPNHFIITNTKFEYPATGGVGTLPYMLIGLLLMAVALIIRKHKWSGGDGSREWIP